MTTASPALSLRTSAMPRRSLLNPPTTPGPNMLSSTGAAGLPSEVTEIPTDLLERFPHTKRVGHYLIGKLLGQGSFAKVKLGLHELTGERVAVKIVDKKEAEKDPYVRANMKREGRLLQKLRHPNIVMLYEIMETSNSYYLVTEWCEGGDFLMYVCQRGRLTESESRRFIRQIILAVRYLHATGVQHRDLKIENFMLDKRNNIKIIDFGLSNYAPGRSTLGSTATGGSAGSTTDDSSTGALAGAGADASTPDDKDMTEAMMENLVKRTQCGSPAYAAPELIRDGRYGLEVDVWSIGVNLFAMLTGALPFTTQPFNITKLYEKMMNREMNPLPDSVGNEARSLIVKLLEPDPCKRITLDRALTHPWMNDLNCGKPNGAGPGRDSWFGGAASVRDGPPVETEFDFAMPSSTHDVNHVTGTKDEPIDSAVARHASNISSLDLTTLIRYVQARIPHSGAATYHLLLARLRRHKAKSIGRRVNRKGPAGSQTPMLGGNLHRSNSNDTIKSDNHAAQRRRLQRQQMNSQAVQHNNNKPTVPPTPHKTPPTPAHPKPLPVENVPDSPSKRRSINRAPPGNPNAIENNNHRATPDPNSNTTPEVTPVGTPQAAVNNGSAKPVVSVPPSTPAPASRGLSFALIQKLRFPGSRRKDPPSEVFIKPKLQPSTSSGISTPQDSKIKRFSRPNSRLDASQPRSPPQSPMKSTPARKKLISLDLSFLHSK